MIYKIPWEYDYHHQAEILVIADSPEEATEKARARVLKYVKENYSLDEDDPEDVAYVNDRFKINRLGLAEEFKEDVYLNTGCDC